MRLVVGLGNPGARYARTRHNVGFVVVERLAARAGVSIDRKLHGALIAEAPLAGQKVMLAEPQQFMNVSGQPVASIAGFYKVPAADIVVVHDDMDLPFGRLRVRSGGGHGGHNGIRDIQRVLGADFVRVRVGVGRPPEGWDAADYVLANWSPEEAARLADVIDQAASATEAVLRDGLAVAMNTYNPVEPARNRAPAPPSAEGTPLPSPRSGSTPEPHPSSKRKHA